MMKLEIRNLQTSKTHEILAEGVVLGREGGEAEIRVADSGVSKRHARIFSRRGLWFLEDLKSANGTFLAEQRLSEPAPLSQGVVFAVSRSKFEVVTLVEEPEETTLSQQGPRPELVEQPTSPRAPTTDILAAAGKSSRGVGSGLLDEVPEPEPFLATSLGRDVESLPTEIGGILPNLLDAEKSFTPTSAPGRETSGLTASPLDAGREDTSPHAPALKDPGQGDDPTRTEIGRGPEPTAAADGAPQSAASPPPRTETGGSDPSTTMELIQSSVKNPASDFVAALKKATRWYAVQVPRLLIHPVHEVAEAIEDPQVEVLEPLDLVAFSLPVGLWWVALSMIGQLAVQLISPSFSVTALLPVGALIGAAIGAVVSGYLFHPLTRWLVDRLNGQSTAKSRSNFFATLQTATAIAAIPSTLGVLVSVMHLPFIGVIPALLSIATAGLTAYVVYAWFRAFNVVEWFQYALVGLGVLACLGAATGFVSAMALGIRGADRPMVAEPIAATHVDLPRHDVPIHNSEPSVVVVAQGDPVKPPTPTTVEPAVAKVAPTSHVEPAVSQRPVAETAEAPVETHPVVAMASPTPPAEMATAPAHSDSSAPAMTFTEFNRRKQLVESSIHANPMLLRKVSGLLPLYEKLHRTTYDVEKKYEKLNRRAHPSQVDVNQRLKEAETFEATGPLVYEIYEKLNAVPAP